MKKGLLALLTILPTLAACESADEQRARIERRLPSGCVMVDLGRYGQIDHLVTIVCEGRATTTNGARRYWSGKVLVEKVYTIHAGPEVSL